VTATKVELLELVERDLPEDEQRAPPGRELGQLAAVEHGGEHERPDVGRARPRGTGRQEPVCRQSGWQ